MSIHLVLHLPRLVAWERRATVADRQTLRKFIYGLWLWFISCNTFQESVLSPFLHVVMAHQCQYPSRIPPEPIMVIDNQFLYPSRVCPEPILHVVVMAHQCRYQSNVTYCGYGSSNISPDCCYRAWVLVFVKIPSWANSYILRLWKK